jgi:hypothetical protein
MDSYVVTIYRRPDQDGGQLAGLVERIGDGEQRAFQNGGQLLEYLSREGATRGQTPARRSPSNKRTQR